MFDKLKQLGELKKMRDQAMKLQKALAEELVTAEEDNLKVVISGDQKIQKIEIDGERQGKLEDLINKAIKESQKIAASKMQEMGGLGGLLG